MAGTRDQACSGMHQSQQTPGRNFPSTVVGMITIRRTGFGVLGLLMVNTPILCGLWGNKAKKFYNSSQLFLVLRRL